MLHVAPGLAPHAELLAVAVVIAPAALRQGGGQEQDQGEREEQPHLVRCAEVQIRIIDDVCSRFAL